MRSCPSVELLRCCTFTQSDVLILPLVFFAGHCEAKLQRCLHVWFVYRCHAVVLLLDRSADLGKKSATLCLHIGAGTRKVALGGLKRTDRMYSYATVKPKTTDGIFTLVFVNTRKCLLTSPHVSADAQTRCHLVAPGASKSDSKILADSPPSPWCQSCFFFFFSVSSQNLFLSVSLRGSIALRAGQWWRQNKHNRCMKTSAGRPDRRLLAAVNEALVFEGSRSLWALL